MHPRQIDRAAEILDPINLLSRLWTAPRSQTLRVSFYRRPFDLWTRDRVAESRLFVCLFPTTGTFHARAVEWVGGMAEPVDSDVRNLEEVSEGFFCVCVCVCGFIFDIAVLLLLSLFFFCCCCLRRGAPAGFLW